MAELSTVTYYDADGNKQTGYMNAGIAYKDAALSSRVDSGSLINNNGSLIVATNAGGIAYSDYIKTQEAGKNSQSLIDQYTGALSGAAQSREDASLAALDAQLPKINQNYDDNAQDLWTNYELGQKGAANELASAGLYNSGYADTYKTRQRVGYEGNYNVNEQGRLGALADIDTQKTQARFSGDADRAEIEALAAQLGLSQYNTERDYQSSLSAKTLQNAYTAANIGDFSQLEALGIDTAAAKKLWDAQMVAAAPSSNSGSSSGSGSGSGAGSGSSNNYGLSDSAYEYAIQTAKSFVSNYISASDMTASKVNDFVTRAKDYMTEKFGESFYEAYKDYIFKNYPGMSEYEAEKPVYDADSLANTWARAIGMGTAKQEDLTKTLEEYVKLGIYTSFEAAQIGNRVALMVDSGEYAK